MFKKEPSPLLVALDVAIEDVYSEMLGLNSDADEYDRASNQLVKLMKLREEITSKNRISPDALATIAAHLAGILLILNFEKANVVASKALGFVMKLR